MLVVLEGKGIKFVSSCAGKGNSFVSRSRGKGTRLFVDDEGKGRDSSPIGTLYLCAIINIISNKQFVVVEGKYEETLPFPSSSTNDLVPFPLLLQTKLFPFPAQLQTNLFPFPSRTTSKEYKILKKSTHLTNL